MLYYDPIQRRFFIQTATAFLAMPFLPSLVPKAHAQGPGNKKYSVFITCPNGIWRYYWNQHVAATQDVGGGVFTRNLNQVSGNIAPYLDNKFNTFKDKMALIRGLDMIYREGHSDEPLAAGHHTSIDQILASSSSFYQGVTPAIDSLIFSNMKGSYGGHSQYSKRNGKILPAYVDPQAIYDRIFYLSNAANKQKNANAMDFVKTAIQRVKNHPRIGTQDRHAVEEHESMVGNLSQNILNTGLPQCSPLPIRPTSALSSLNLDQIIELHTDLMVMAFKCDLTRVVHFPIQDCGGVFGFNSIGSGHAWGAWHNYTHNSNWQFSSSNQLNSGLEEITKWVMDGYLHKIMTKLNANTNSDNQNLLDRSGILLSYNTADGSSHTNWDTPCIMAGGFGGSASLGKIVDYTARSAPFYPTGDAKPGVYYNRMLVTYLHMMGLSTSQYLSGNETLGAINGAAKNYAPSGHFGNNHHSLLTEIVA